MAGGQVFFFRIMGVLPRWLALWIMAKVWIQKKSA
jgi:hypothetical protein